MHCPNCVILGNHPRINLQKTPKGWTCGKCGYVEKRSRDERRAERRRSRA